MRQRLLEWLLECDSLQVVLYRQARLRNNDVLSSALDSSQPKSDNRWGLVWFRDHRGRVVDLCVMQVQYYTKVHIESDVHQGFDPEVCRGHGLDVPVSPGGGIIKHQPMRVAVGKMWLAAGATEAQGAVGCREGIDPDGGLPPDLVLVKSLSESGPVLRGTRSATLQSATRNRYYGLYAVRIDEIWCQLGPTSYIPELGCHCFLTSSKKSGKLLTR